MQKILNFVREDPRIADSTFVEESRDYNALYYLAEQRNCALYVFPFKKGDKVFLVDGMGGAFTEFLLEKGCEVCAWEKSMETLLLHKLRVERVEKTGLDVKTNITQYDFHNLIKDMEAGNHKDFAEMFDYIIAFDVLPMVEKENASLYIKCLSDCLKQDGQLVITSENPEGIRYKAGAKLPYENQNQALTGKELKELVEGTDSNINLEVKQCFYPFPDGYFPTAIYSDDYLPKKGELHEQVKLSKEPRVIYFDEDKAFDQAIVDNKFTEVAHTSMVVLTKKSVDSPSTANKDERVIYAKFSNNRAEEYGLYTIIIEDKNSGRAVKKLPLGEMAQGHIWHLHDMDFAFDKLYEKSRFVTNAHRKEADGLRFEFVKGRPFSEKLDEFIDKKDIDGFANLLDEYIFEIKNLYSKKGFSADAEFLQMFGDLPTDSSISFANLLCGKPINIDLIPDNILESNADWVIIDSEWGFDFEIPVNYVVYRVIHYYLATNTKRNIFTEQELFERHDISREEQVWYENMEKHFQGQIAAKGSTIFSQKLATLAPAVAIETLLNRYAGYTQATVYFDDGHGYSEDNTLRKVLRPSDSGYTMDIPVTEKTRRIRFDIAENSCILTSVDVRFAPDDNLANEKIVKFSHNGYRDKNALLFVTQDPQIEVKTEKLQKGILRINCDYDAVSESVIRAMLPKRKQ